VNVRNDGVKVASECLRLVGSEHDVGPQFRGDVSRFKPGPEPLPKLSELADFARDSYSKHGHTTDRARIGLIETDPHPRGQLQEERK